MRHSGPLQAELCQSAFEWPYFSRHLSFLAAIEVHLLSLEDSCIPTSIRARHHGGTKGNSTSNVSLEAIHMRALTVPKEPFPTPFKPNGNESGGRVEYLAQDLAKTMLASRRSKNDFLLNGQQYRAMDIIERPEANMEFLEGELCVPKSQ